MRLTSIFFRNARQPQNEKNVPFKAMTPLALKNYVTSTKNQKGAVHGCLYEISLLLSCLEENENEDKNCIPQFNTVHACYEKYVHDMKKQKIQSGNLQPVPNSRNQTPAQISYLLRRFPTK